MILSCVVAAAISSCGRPANDYSAYHNFPESQWRYGDTIRFIPTHPDSIARGRLAIGVRHSNDFEYSTLWLEVVTENPAGRRRVDTVSIPLADSYGRWVGQGIGASFQCTDTIATPILHQSGAPVKIRHIMRADTLAGITQLGLFFLP